MEIEQYRDAVAAAAREHGFDPVAPDHDRFDRAWETSADDRTIGDLRSLATVVDATGYGPDDVRADVERFREALIDRFGTSREASTTLFGYVTFAHPDPDPESIATAIDDHTVADRRSCVFPLVYDLGERTLHTHPVPRLKKRGLYRRQVTDAERLFDAEG
ncbi:hypothetical protein GRS48_09085 [Halorubrum sp. JWXQ-INN 858]|uniref:hypothetical protein n=1 Tax=Halorubrum sp. JWXQ-INN 858 TaxID=2690782 RepID=UPI00135B056E|nr:hypothetical protein [Halorubrum sp. JWXQ-INN 858]MWV64970.1 hypothetical protein [Halorubrum sp. JWXQ-INN 858]